MSQEDGAAVLESWNLWIKYDGSSRADGDFRQLQGGAGSDIAITWVTLHLNQSNKDSAHTYQVIIIKSSNFNSTPDTTRI